MLKPFRSNVTPYAFTSAAYLSSTASSPSFTVLYAGAFEQALVSVS